MANKKLIKKFLTIGVITSPLLLFLPSALIRVDNKEAETGDYDQINIFSTTTRNANTAVEKYETGSWNKEVWGKVDRTWFPKNDDPLKPETIMEIYENGRWVELQNSAGQKTIWNPSDDSANALNPNFVKKIRLRYLSMRAYQDQDSMLIPENYFSGGFWFSKDIVLASNIDVKIYDARKSKYKTSPKLERHETVTIDPFSFSYTSRTTVSPTVISNTTTTDGTSEESVSKQFSSRYNAFYTENPLTGAKNTSWSDNSDWGTTDIVHDIFSFNGAAFLNKYALYKPDNGLYNDAASFAKSDGWITIRNSLGGYFYFASGRGTQARPQEVVLEFDVRFNINSDGTTTNDFNSTTRSFFGTTQAYRYDNQSLLQKFSMQKPSFWRNTNLIIKEEYDDRVKKSFNTLDLNAPQAEFYLVNTQLNSSKNLNDSNSVVKINRNNISNYSDFSKPFTNKAVIQESIDIDNVDSASTTPSTWQASNIELVIKQDEKSKKYWKFANNNGRFTLSDRNNFSSEANINSNIVWSLTDYGTVIATIKESKWLTNLQKAQLMADLEKQIDQDYNLPGGTGKRNLNEWIAYVKAYDDLQKQIEEKFFETVNYASSDEKVTVDDYDGTKKLDYLFSTPAYKNNIDSRKFSYWQYAAYKSNEFNQSEKLFDRSNAPTTVSYNNLQSTLAIWKGANFGTPNGLKNLKALEDKINNYAVIADSEYNKQQIKTFIEKIKNKALNDFVNIQVKNDQGQSSTTLANAWKANWKYDYLGDIQKLEKAVSLANDIYTKTKTFNQELDTIKTSDLFTGGSTLIDKNQANTSYVWDGQNAREQFSNVNEPAWTKLMNQLIGSDNENNKANNVFASETNLLSANLKQNYLTGFNNLVTSLDNIFGNGGKLAEEFKKYVYIDAKKYYDIANESSALTNWFGKISKINVAETEYGNRHNFATNANQEFVLTKPDQNEINGYLLQISNAVYKESASAVKAQIKSLQNLSDAQKQTFKGEIDKLIDTNLDTNKLNVVYKNDSDFTKTLNLAKEQNRINGMTKALASDENKFGYDQANNQTKSNTLVRDAQLVKFYPIDTLTDAIVEIKAIAQKEQLDDSGRAKLNFVVKSTKNLYNTTIQSDETTSNWITGFAADRVQEKQRIDALNATFALKTAKSVLAREITKENFAQYIDVNGINDKTDEIVLKDNSFVVDDKTGTLTFDYVIKSKRINDIETEQRQATVNNFKTEVERLNELVANIKKNTLTVSNNSISNQANRLPSEIQDNEIVFGALNNQNALVKINNITKNDENGTITVDYALQSSIANLNDQVSSDTNSIVLNGFLTTLEKKRREVLAKINNSQLLTKQEQASFSNEANAQEQTVQKLNQLTIKVEKYEIANKVATTYLNLNDNQAYRIADQIRNATDKQTSEQMFNNASVLNDKMGALSTTVVDQLKVLTNNGSLNDNQNSDEKTNVIYKLASDDLKQAYDTALSVAQALLNKKTGTNGDLQKVEKTLSDLHATYNALNGNNKVSELNNKIDQLGNLSANQKAKIKELINNASSAKQADKIYQEAEKLNANLQALIDKIAEAKAKQAKDIYTNDTKAKHTAFDKAISAAEKTLNNFKQDNFANIDSLDKLTQINTNVVNETKKLNDEIEKLDGKRQILRDEINNYDNSLLIDKQRFLTQIETLDQNNPDQSKVDEILSSAFAGAKAKANEIVAALANLSNDEQTKYKQQLDNAQKATIASPDANLLTIIQAAQADNNAKEQAIKHIKQLNDLNQAQKDALVTEITNSNVDQIEAIKEKANNLDQAMTNAKVTILNELKSLIENANLELNDDAYSADKTLDNYQFASHDVKANYDAELAKIKELLSQNTDKATIDQALKELEKAYNALDGEENKNKKAKAVDKLDNLSEDQKDNIKDLLNNATDEEAAQKILEKAQKLDLALGDLEKQITSTEAKVATSIYTNDAQDRKEAVDQALKNAKAKLAELKAKDLSNATADSLNDLADEANQSKETLKVADEALDGNREVLRNDISNHFPSLNENQKGLSIAEIEKLPKVPTQEETEAIYGKALKYAQTNAKDELDKLDNLNKAEQDTYIAKIDVTTLDKTKKDFAINVKNLLDQAKADETAKIQAIETIDNLTNLNPSQKLALTQEVKNNLASEANNIVKKAKAIDDKMKAYKDIAEVNKQSTDYVEADEDRQTRYNNQIAIRAEDLGANGTNLSAEQIDAKIAEFNSAINGLNGDEKVAQAKENAIAKIEGKNPVYTNLTAQQKAEAIAKINEKDRVADVNSVDANNALVNGTMATLGQYLNNETQIKNDINYTGSEEDLREAYDDAIQALKYYKIALNESSDDTKDILNNDKIEEKINAVHEAINNLNGKEHIQTVRAEEIAKINALENINDAQKLALIAKVDKATTPEDVRSVTEEAEALDEKMAELKQAVADNQDIPNSVDYKNATEEKMREFDKAFNDASNLADKENGSAELSIDNTDSLIEKLNVAAQNLDGDEKINNKKAEAKNVINSLEHLNDAQKTDLIEEVDKAKLLANVDKVVDKAQTLNNAMGQLKETAKAINDELTQPDNPKYVAASQEPKANYDEAKTKVDELISKQGANEDVAKVLELQKALIDAKNALDGDKNFEYAKEKAIEKVNENKNLTPAEKQALIDRVKDLVIPSNSDNADEVQNFKDNLDKIVNKTNLINDVKNNANLTAEQKADLIDDIEKANVDDKLNSEDEKNSYGDTLDNIKAKEKAYERINATDDSQLNAEDKAKLSDNISQLDPRDKTFADQLANEELKENKIKEIRSNPNLTDDQKSQLIDEVANLDNKQDDLENQIADIDQKAKLIEKIQTNEHISDEDKNKLVNEVINVPHDDSKLTDKLNNIESKLNLIDQIKQNPNLDENTKEALIDQVHNIPNDSDDFNKQADNISAKVKAIEEIKANDELTKENKANLVNEIIDLDNNQTKSSLDHQISNVDKKAELYEQINQSDLPQAQKDALIAELDPINANSENALVSFDNIKDQLNKLRKINNDQTLSDNDKAKLVKDVLANNPIEQNYNEIAKNIDKKQEAIDQVRQNPNLTQEQKDSISQNIRELDETSDEFANKLDNEKARLDLIDQLYQEATDNKISDETRGKLISETLNLANDSSFINNLNNVKAKDKLIQQVKASDVLNDTTKATLINNILDNNATSTEFDNKHNQISQLYVDAEELTKAKNDLVDLTKSKKFEKLTKAKQDAINKAIADSDEILNNLNSHNNEDVVKQTTIDKRLKEASPILIWPYIVAVSAVTWLIGMLIFVFGRKKK
ncbi:lipoprotein 17-related variable surface protein [Mycoplasma sp. 2045]|uniref:lipoprotein 17-related variable surface protein n=1 Tax=Mycoplasma sp. 2045 TaxID=2967301 RepID=UPI00211B925D|nr:lipoprotein 17-related variable surface protein [Mycoplasma sp. 2045]UUM20183.1 lipoprotein 17-related variable surface protein [Mycoplasma sp. 2045]